jgi:AraC-like DNA-binding protein
MLLDPVSQRSFDAAVTPPEQRRALCAATLGAIVGPVSVLGDDSALACARGLCCAAGRLRVMTCYFPRREVVLQGAGAGARVLMARSMEAGLVVRQSGRAATLSPGEFLFLSAAEPFELRLPEGGRLDCGSIPVADFPASGGEVGRFLMRPIPQAYPPLKLLITQAAYLLMRGRHAPGEAELVEAHFRQILPMVVDHLRHEDAADGADGALSQIRAFIESRLTDPDLDLAAVAARFGVTPRHVQKLFQRAGATFSRHVLERRLELALALILRRSGDPVGAIAYEAGFGDLSYFNRAFRRRFGETPTGLRARVGASADRAADGAGGGSSHD